MSNHKAIKLCMQAVNLCYKEEICKEIQEKLLERMGPIAVDRIGYWIDNKYCSNCFCSLDPRTLSTGEINYCPNCGSFILGGLMK